MLILGTVRTGRLIQTVSRQYSSSEVIDVHVPKTRARQLACLGGAALLAGIWVFPGGIAWLPQDAGRQPAVTESQREEKPAPVLPLPQTAATRQYLVQAGDTLSHIAQQHGIDVETLLAANPGVSELIHPGDLLVILPAKGLVHQVQAGDTLWDIAHTYGIPVEKIKAANTKAGDQVVIGERLFIPGARWARSEPAVARAAISRFAWPAKGEISSQFGWRWGRLHAGVDIANELGTYVVSAQAGQVIWAGWRGGYGYTVMLDHGDGYVSLYGHLENYFVERGQYVRAGQRIASMGNTGNSTGPHLHFEIQKDGQPVDPASFLP